MNIEEYRNYAKEARDKNSLQEMELIAAEALEEVDRLQKLLSDLQTPGSAEKIVKLLYDMPWTCKLHGPRGENESSFAIQGRYLNGSGEIDIAKGNQLLEVLEEAAKDNWQNEKRIYRSADRG